MRQNSSFKKLMSKPYFRLLVSYIIILSVITIFFTVSYYRIANSIREEKLSETFISLQRTCNAIDEQILKFREQLHNISTNDEICRIALINTPLKPVHYQWLNNAYNIIEKYGLTGGFIAECVFVFNPDKPFILTTRHIITNPHEYYNAGLFKYNGISYDEFRNFLISFWGNEHDYLYFMPSMNTNIYNEGTIDAITLILPLRIAGMRKHPITLVLIDSESIMNYFFPFLTSDDGWFCITDYKGNIIFSKNYKDEILPKPSQKSQIFTIGRDSVMYVSSSGTNLTYYMCISGNWIDNQMKPYWIAFYLILAVCIIIGLIISAFFAYYNIKPVARIVRKINHSFSSIAEPNASYDYIEKSFDTIMTSNEEMKKKLEKWSPIIRTGLYERIFKDGIISEHEYELVPEMKMYASGWFRVAVIGWHPYPSKSINHSVHHIISIISNCIEENFKAYIIHPLDGEKAAVLLCKDEYRDVNVLYKKLIEITDYLSNTLNLLFAAGIGGEYSGLSMISVSCFEANRALAGISDWHNYRVMKYECFSYRATKYDFSFEHMNKLYNYVLSGDIKSLKILVDQVYNRNFNNKIYDDVNVEQFYNDLLRILNKLSSELPIDDILKNVSGLSTFSDASDVMSYFLTIFEKAAEISKEQKTEASKELVKQVLDYIDNNYNDPNMSLQSLAMEFGMSEKYMSLFLKEKAGFNFSKFLEDKRLTEAARLMVETDKSIQEIQELVGYTSTNTFYKAFRRKYGISPTVWRKEHVNVTSSCISK